VNALTLAPAPTALDPRPVFYTGAPAEWLWDERITFPTFVSFTRLQRTTPWRSTHRWAMDSGGFTELQKHGGWRLTAAQYARYVKRYASIGRMDWAAPQDWMCEPQVIAGGTVGRETFVGTGLSVREHQERTVDNYLELRALAPTLPWCPVVQGWELADYVACVAMYERAGVDLTTLPVVGLGSVCRRQDTDEIVTLVTAMRDLGLTRIHAFGVKLAGLERLAHLADEGAHPLASCDSTAWSLHYSKRPAFPGCTHKHCGNCPKGARAYRQRLDGLVAA
jgi:hypothetical protein